MEETVDGDQRCRYRSQTSQSSSHNPGDHGILLNISVDYRCVDDNLRENIIDGSTGDYGIRGIRYQYISH